MPLPWVRLDGNFSTHDKTIRLISEYGNAGRSAGFVYLCGLGYCGHNGTDGLIEFGALPFIHGRKRDAEILVEVGLWKPHPLGWEMPNWLERQQSSAKTEAVHRGKRRAGVMGNCVRWHGKDCGCWRDAEV